jgi:hypothetical protein
MGLQTIAKLLVATWSLIFAATVWATDDVVDYHYRGTVTIDPASGHLSANWTIDVLHDSTEPVTFYIRDTLGNITASGPSLRSSDVQKVSGFQDFWGITITLEEPSSAGPRQVQLAYDGILIPEPMGNRINTISEDVIELNVDSFWFPIDAAFSRMIATDLTVHVPGAWKGISTGTVTSDADGIKIRNTSPRIDIAFTLAEDPRVETTEHYEIFDLRPDGKGLQELKKTADACYTELNTSYGAHNPLQRGKFVITTRNESGYARTNYIVLTDIGDTTPERLTQFICHEFAHYWSQGADFGTVENWLNEAFAEYTALEAVRNILGEDAYSLQIGRFEKQIADQTLPPIWREGDTARGPYLVQYRKAPLLITRFAQDIGREKVLAIIRAFWRQHIRTTPKLLEIIETEAGLEARQTFTRYLAS